MPKFILSCSSTADMPRSYFDEKNIPLAYFHFTIDGETYPDDLGESIPFPDFYKRMDAGADTETSQVNVAEYIALFEPFLQSGEDIIHLTLSSGISGSYSAGKTAETELRQKYPERRIYVIDSIGASSGYGLLVDSVCALRDNDTDIETAVKWIEENKANVNHWFFVSNLKHLRKGGRVSGAAAVVGSLLNICPVLDVDIYGRLIPRAKVRGKKNVVADLVNRMKALARDGVNYTGKCFISNSACREDAEELARLIRQEFKNIDGDIMINEIGTVIGSHTGPGTVALFFWGKKRTE